MLALIKALLTTEEPKLVRRAPTPIGARFSHKLDVWKTYVCPSKAKAQVMAGRAISRGHDALATPNLSGTVYACRIKAKTRKSAQEDTMSYTVAVSHTPGVTNLLRTRKGKPLLHRTRQEAEWRAWLTLQDTPPWFGTRKDGSEIVRHPFVEVRQGKTVLLRWVKGSQRPDGSYMIHRFGTPATFRGTPPTQG